MDHFRNLLVPSPQLSPLPFSSGYHCTQVLYQSATKGVGLMPLGYNRTTYRIKPNSLPDATLLSPASLTSPIVHHMVQTAMLVNKVRLCYIKLREMKSEIKYRNIS